MRYLYILFLLFLAAIYASANPVVQQGEVWDGDKKLTSTAGKIDALWISPSGKFAAYTVINGYLEEYGEFDVEPPKSPSHFVVVYDLKNFKTIHEIHTQDRFIYVTGWTASDVLLLSGGSSLEATGMYSYEPTLNKLVTYEMNDWDIWEKLKDEIPAVAAQPIVAPDAAPRRR